jgi:hypothetical protein
MDLGSTNKEIAHAVGVDEGTLSRAHSCSEDLQLGLDKLKDLVEALRVHGDQVRVALLHRVFAHYPPPLTVLDLCSSRPLTAEVVAQIKGIVYSNLTSRLTHSSAERLALPDGFGAVLVQVGPRENHLYLLQIEGASDVEVLRNMIHELEDLRDRKENETIGPRSRRRHQHKKPKHTGSKSAF